MSERNLLEVVTAVEPRHARFILTRQLGRGGSAEVWRAKPLDGGDDVCIKRPLSCLNATQRRALREEARLLARIRHDNVVTLFEALEDQTSRVFLVLELVRGADLKSLGRRLRHFGRRASDDVAAFVGLCVCRALSAAERAVPLVHRDITPQNVLVSTHGDVKLADFGLARAADRERWTRPGVVQGKLGYVSPEQLRNEEVDVKSDLFSLGVVLFELLANAPPFQRRPDLSTVENPEPPSLALARRRVRPEVAAAIAALLAPARGDRPSLAEAERTFFALADVGRARTELAEIATAARGRAH